MSANARLIVLIIGGLFVLGGIAGLATGFEAIGPLAIGIVILIGTLFDYGYRGRNGQPTPSGAAWQRTGEREIDTLTGEPREVWFDPVTGARRYEPMGSDPNRH